MGKLTTLRSQWVTPLSSLLLTVGATYAANAALGRVDDNLTRDQSVGVFYGLNFSQVALRNLDDPQIHYGHWTGLALMAAWSAAAACGGWRALRRHDA
ncbi:hypothetical protein [Kitasatospora sp. GP82]|uniref:hypothetical protein n=1 Tax=Kitasatospora sp. GP82 TaxID=3035089 RepID=UPI0024730520|nr:hypothetical protein [Kitasatospora sp. GP82]MDH6125595.1 hypothetical protein [Kitasatospora sp. GP82]